MSTVTDAFQKLLKTLCLHEFPCGNGSWRKQATVQKFPLNYGKQVLKLVDNTEAQFSVTLKNCQSGARVEHIETLQEFVSAKHSPWTFDYSWSDEARSLREIAVKSPELITKEYIHQHFQTLRLTDKDIHEVDENLLKFTNLQYITLSANYIKNVNSKNLPRKLLSLELNSNQISELFSLCLDPPALVHLGLGTNCLTYVDDYLSGEHWPALLSLDLSYNNLTDLPETLRKLKTLPNLRNLILMGNPLMLAPGYRGFVIDNLPKIDLLDDSRIEADERHKYKKMSHITEQELCQCLITFQVGKIKNAPVPSELLHPDDQPEYPIITRNYYVEFHYIEEASMEADVFALHQDAGATMGFDPFAAPMGGESGVESSYGQQDMITPVSDMPASSMAADDAAYAPSDDFAMLILDNNSVVNQHMGMGMLVLDEQLTGGQQMPPKKKNNILRSDKGTWAHEIELDWSTTAKREDLLAVRDFLLQPMKVDVVEETILSYPKEEDGEQIGSARKKKDEPKKEEKKTKKKKDMDQDMRHEPPEINILATFDLSLDQFLVGETCYSTTFSKDGAVSRAPSALPTAGAAGAGKPREKLRSADKKGRDGGKGKDDKVAGERKKSATKKDAGKSKSKRKKGRSGKKLLDVEVDPNEPLPALEVDVVINMHLWASTADAIQTEE